MKTHATLTFTVVLEGDDATDKTIRSLLDFMMEHAAGNGMFTGDTDMTVDTYHWEIDTGDTFRIEARGQKTTDEDCGLSEANAREEFHRMGGRGIGIKVVNENTSEVLLQDPDAE